MFTSAFISKALQLPENPQPFTVARIVTDSRTLQPNDLFVAISGENFDGHSFLKHAAERGARGAIVSSQVSYSKEGLSKNFELIEVEDTVSALRKLASAHRGRLTIPVIGVAGSNGKTTTKEWIHFLLSRLIPETEIFKTKKSQNSILGIAMSLLEIREE